MKPQSIVNKLIEISEIRNTFELENAISYRRFGFPPNSICFIDENKSLFEDLIEKLYQHSSAIENTFTLKKFTNNFISEFRSNFVNQINPEPSAINNFFDQLKSQEIIEYYVFREIQGVKFDTNNSSITFGDFTVYNFKDHKEEMGELYQGDIENVTPFGDPNFVVRYNAKARHFEKAIEKSDEFFRRFEAALNFCVGKNSQIEISILNNTGWDQKNAFVLNEKGTLAESTESEGPYKKVPIDDEYFKKEDVGFDKLWPLISQKKFSNIEDRILLALDWIGQSIKERSKTDSFLKAAIALEILLTYDDKAPITPSLTHRLSESTALLIGENMDDRIKIEKKIKSLYGRRSAVVHSGKHVVEESEIHHMLAYVRQIIINLLTKDELSKIDSIQALYKYLKKLKYR